MCSLLTNHLFQRYNQEFAANDSGAGRIGLDEFVKIVTTVTGGRVNVRECRLVYADAGLEFLDREAFLRVTRGYQLRLFDAQLPEVQLNDGELQELHTSVGRTNIASTQRVRPLLPIAPSDRVSDRSFDSPAGVGGPRSALAECTCRAGATTRVAAPEEGNQGSAEETERARRPTGR